MSMQLLAMKRVGILHGGAPHGLEDSKSIPPSQRLRIAQYNELAGPYASGTGASDAEGMFG
jgi:stearoyl-CoA desaturase (delta-9 desaturase)